MYMEQEETGGGARSSGPESPPDLSVSEYLKSVRTLLRSGRRKEAYSVLLKACSVYPSHPLILSYFGWLQAVIDKKPRSGVTFCRRALASFRTRDSYIAGSVYPVLYLNLGRALLLSGRKKEAVESFGKGLAYDRWHRELKQEMTALGIRKQPILPFLSRSNPVNRLLGRLRSVASALL